MLFTFTRIPFVVTKQDTDMEKFWGDIVGYQKQVIE